MDSGIKGLEKEDCSKKTCDNEEMKANQILEKISRLFDEDAIITSDVGQNQIVCAQSLFLRKNNIFFVFGRLSVHGIFIAGCDWRILRFKKQTDHFYQWRWRDYDEPPGITDN